MATNVTESPRSGGQARLHSADQFRTRQRRTFLDRFGPGEVRDDNTAWLDGLRAIAVLLVVVYHVWIRTGQQKWHLLGVDLTWFPVTMGVGVTIFFMLSGYLLSKPWFVSELGDRKRPSVRRFWWRRILRLVPAYYVSVAVVLILFVPSGRIPTNAVTGELGLKNLGGQLLFLQNYLPVSSANLNQSNGAYWSLTIEMTLYVLLPLLVLAFMRRRAWYAVAASLVIAMVWTHLGIYSLDGLVEAMRKSIEGSQQLLGMGPGEAPMRGLLLSSFPAWAFAFALGIGLARLVALHEHGTGAGLEPAWWQHRDIARFALIGGSVLFIYAEHRIGVAAIYLEPSPMWRNYMQHVVPPVGLALLMFGLALHRTLARRPLEWMPLRFIGWVSFGIYLYHLPILFKLLPAPEPDTSALGVVLVLAEVLGIAVAAGTASWLLIERPLLRRPSSRGSHHLGMLGSVVVTLAAIVIAAVVIGTTHKELVIPSASARSTGGMFAAIPKTQVDRKLTGPGTLDATLKLGLMYPEEARLLTACGATTGRHELLVNPQWSVSATTFTCRDSSAVTTVMDGLSAFETSIGFAQVNANASGRAFYKDTDPPTPTHPAQFHVRIANGATVTGLAIQARTKDAGQDAIEDLIKALIAAAAR